MIGCRKRKYDFDRLLYVVDQSQHAHFSKLLLSLHKLDQLPLRAARAVSDFHVAFGRIHGMSTRRGDVVFLSDLLHETVERMRESIHSTHSESRPAFLHRDSPHISLLISFQRRRSQTSTASKQRRAHSPSQLSSSKTCRSGARTAFPSAGSSC